MGHSLQPKMAKFKKFNVTFLLTRLSVPKKDKSGTYVINKSAQKGGQTNERMQILCVYQLI